MTGLSGAVRAALPAAALLVGLELLAIGLYQIEPRTLVLAWDPGAIGRLAAFSAIVFVAGIALFLMPSRLARAVGVALTFGGLIWAFGTAAVLSAGLLLVGAIAWGALLSNGFKEHRPAASDLALRVLLRMAVGLAILVCLANSLTHFPINGPALYLGVLLAPMVIEVHTLVSLGQSLVKWLVDDGRRPFGEGAGILLLATVIALHIAHAALPEMYWDAVGMHLYAPTYVSVFREWSYDPALFGWAAWPLGADWLFTYAFVLGGEEAAKLVNVAMAAATSWMLYLYLTRSMSAAWSALVTAACMSAPILVLQSTSLLVENTLMFFMLTGFLMLERLDPRWQSWFRFGLLVAALCSVKLHGAVFGVGLTMLASWRAVRFATVRPPPWVWAFALPGFLLAIQPYATAYWLTGNPLFPFFNAIFQSPLFPSTGNFVDTRYARGWSLDSLWNMTFYSSEYLESFSPGAPGYLILSIGPLALVSLAAKRAPSNLLALVVACWFLAIVGSSVQHVRYFSPILPVLTIAGAMATQIGGHFVAVGLRVALVGIVFLNILSIPSGGWHLKGFYPSRLLESDGRTHLLEELIPQRILTDRINQRESAPTTVTYFGVPAAAGLRGTAIYYSWYNTAFMSAVSDATTEDGLAQAIGETGSKYVIVNVAAGSVPDSLIRTLEAHATLIDRVGWAQLFLLDPEFRLKQELLQNAGFDHDTAGWATTSVVQRTTGGVAHLAPGTDFTQVVSIMSGGRRFEGYASLDCVSPETLVVIRLESWDAVGGQFIALNTERAACAATSSLSVSFAGRVPESTQVLRVVVSAIGGGGVGVDEISLRSELR